MGYWILVTKGEIEITDETRSTLGEAVECAAGLAEQYPKAHVTIRDFKGRPLDLNAEEQTRLDDAISNGRSAANLPETEASLMPGKI